MKFRTPWILALPVLLMIANPVRAQTPIPGDSVYQLKVQLVTSAGKTLPFHELRGRPALISMFYASCGGVCPTIAFTMRRMEAALTPAQRNSLRSVMVSFDPQHDSNSALAEFARLNELEDPRWIVARTPEASVRDMAAVLGVRYRPLPGGGFSHSTVIALLDENGRILARTEQLSTLDPGFMKLLVSTLESFAARGGR